jgi:ATP-binding cassette subfamily B protein
MTLPGGAPRNPAGAEGVRSPVPGVAGIAVRLIRTDPKAYGLAIFTWTVFHMSPLVVGALVKLVLDHLTSTDGGTPWMLLAAVLGAEVARWSVLIWSAWQWQGAWVGWNSVPRVNALTSLATGRGPTAGRLPGSSGEAVSRFRDDSHDLAMVLDSWLDLAGTGLAAVVAVIVMFTVDARAAAIVLIPMGLSIALSLRLGPRLRAWRRQTRLATSGVTSFIGDTFAGVLAVKAGGAEAAYQHRFQQLNADRAEASRRDQLGRQVLNSISVGTGELTTGIVLVVVAATFRQGQLSVGDVSLFASYVTIVSGAPRWLGRVAIWMQQAEVSVERLADLMEGERVAPVRPVATHLRHGPPPLPRPRPAAESLNELRVDGLTALHGESDHGVVDVSLAVRSGQLVAITGEVGSGKTTLLRAILGVVPSQAGTIRWNGVPVDDPATQLVPPRVAYLPQVPRLFSEPLAETILLGLPDDELDRAVWLACLEDDVAEMADGLATVIGPRGLRLSGGQAQRAAAARALVRRPQLLVVDDLSSALDVETETRLWQRLADQPHRTVLLVSHRPGVLDAADEVIVLDRGRRL